MPPNTMRDWFSRLLAVRFSTADLAAIAEVPLARLTGRLKQQSLPLLFPPLPIGSGNRRAFTIREAYALRLVEAFMSAGLTAQDADAAVSDVMETVPPFLLPYVPEWPEQWRGRDMAVPTLIYAMRYTAEGAGWATTFAAPDEPLSAAMSFMPKPRGGTFLARTSREPVGSPMAVVVVNLTRELVAADRLIAECRPELSPVPADMEADADE